MRLGLIIGLVLSVQLAIAGEKGVSWTSIDPFCGQLTSAEPTIFPIKAAEIKLYRPTAKHLPCCASAEPLGSVREDPKGNFDLRKLSPGQYRLVAKWGKIEVPVALWSVRIILLAPSDTSTSSKLSRVRKLRSGSLLSQTIL
jgi:hypothetical protein